MSPALQAIALSRRFGGLLAVSEVSFDLHPGQLLAIIGPNGAGKSTLVALLAGTLPVSGGSVRLDGADVSDWPDWRRARAGIGRSFQRSSLMPDMNVRENVRLAAQAARTGVRTMLRAAARDRELLDAADAAVRRVGLQAYAGVPAGALSHGQRRLLEIAIVLAGRPKVLLLDEPLAGMGAEESAPLAALLQDLAREHAVLLIEHDMDVVFAVADRLIVMVDGRVLEQGTPSQIRASVAVRDAYLGHPV